MSADKDLAFLQEMRERFGSGRARDATQLDYVQTMIDDWIHELSTGETGALPEDLRGMTVVDLKQILRWEAHRMGAVSTGTLKSVIQRLETAAARQGDDDKPKAPEAWQAALIGAQSAMHRVLCAGGDGGDELSDLELRQVLKDAKIHVELVLKNAGVTP